MAWYRCGTGIPQSVKDIPTVSSAIGSIATFDTDLTENLVKCVAEIEADANGVTSVTVIDVSTLNNIPFDITVYRRYLSSDSQTWRYSSDSTSIAIPCLPNTTYIITGYPQNVGIYRFCTIREASLPTTSSQTNINVYQYANYTSYEAVGKAYTFTTDASATYIVIQISSTGMSDFITNGTVATGNNIIVSLGETLTQGGSLDVISGLLTRTDTTTKQLTGGYLSTYAGANNIIADTGDIDVKYLETVGHKIS